MIVVCRPLRWRLFVHENATKKPLAPRLLEVSAKIKQILSEIDFHSTRNDCNIAENLNGIKTWVERDIKESQLNLTRLSTRRPLRDLIAEKVIGLYELSFWKTGKTL